MAEEILEGCYLFRTPPLSDMRATIDEISGSHKALGLITKHSYQA